MFIGNASYRSTITCAFLLAVFFMAQPVSAAGSGSIKGFVFDNQSKDALVGANVVIQGTSLGIAADIDGKYEIKNIPVGNWKMKVSCIGYLPMVRDIVISENQTIEQEFLLITQAITGEEVIVTAQGRGQVQAINQQISSEKIVSVVSEARIQELPDFNAAQAISRLPGVSTLESSGEANKIVIRGLSPQFNAVAVGGISLASTGSTQIGQTSSPGVSQNNANQISTDRSVDLTMVTPYMIKSIEVFKSLTPDMNANAIGGFVNMTLREAPSGLHSDLMWQSGYTEKNHKYDNYRAIASVSDRFLDDRLGAYLLINGEKYDRDADNMTGTYDIDNKDRDSTGWRPVVVNTVTLNRHIETRKRFGGNLILDYKFSTGIIRSINMFSRLNSEFQDYNQGLDYINHNVAYTYRAGEGNTDLTVNVLEFENDFGFMSMVLKIGNTYSRNNLPDSYFYQFQQTGGVGLGRPPRNTVPEDLFSGVAFLGDSNAIFNRMSLLSTSYKENDQVLKGDFKVPVQVTSNISGFIKFGGEYRQNNHVNDQSTPYTELEQGSENTIKRRMWDAVMAQFPGLEATLGPNQNRLFGNSFASTDAYVKGSFLGNRFGTVLWACDPGILNQVTDFLAGQASLNAIYSSGTDPGGWYDGYFQTLPNDYDYTERYGAGYLMTQMNIGPDLMVVGGLRYEEVNGTFNTYNIADGRNPSTQTYTKISAHPGNHFLLPMVQAKYNINEWSDVRYSYSQTLARPAYNMLSPHKSVSYDRNTAYTSNPNLKPAQAYNHDLMVTFHGNKLGLLSIGGFYKEVDNFSYSTNYRLHATAAHPGYDSLGSFPENMTPKDNALLYTYVNSPYTAYVRGYEIDFQTRFWYLPFPLDGILLGVNYTHIWSKTRYPWTDQYSTLTRPPRTIQIDSSREGRLINQPNDVANAFIGYDYKGFSAKVSFVFQGNTVSYYGAFEEQDAHTEDYYRVDLSIRQMLPWAGLQLFLDVNNLNNRMNKSTQSSISGFTNVKHYGLTANLGIRFTYGL